MLHKARIGWKTAASLVIANMIGTGVFTSLGFQLADVSNTWSIIALWLIGGFLALIGAFVYAQLGTHFKNSGGDYIFLSRTFHPFLGYLYAWTSLTVGFSAPIAIAAMAMVYYLRPFMNVRYGHMMGITTIVMISFFHSVSIKQSGLFHNVFTAIKILFVLALIILGIYYAPQVTSSLDFGSAWKRELLLPGFAVSLIYVSYAYTGWNSAAYIIEEIDSPLKNLPKALISGTLLVTVVYVLLQVVFLKHAAYEQLAGQVEVATISFGNLFSEAATAWISFFISFQLIATISGYIWIGPRVTFAMAKDYRLWRPLAVLNRWGVPVRALWFNSAISILLTLTNSFEQVLLYAGFVLQVMGSLTILSSLFVKHEPGTFKSPFSPYLQIVYLLFSLWVIAYMLYERPFESLAGFGIMGLGAIVYLFDKRIDRTLRSV
jgi:APA family basic amino acid/polyamine antiporter